MRIDEITKNDKDEVLHVVAIHKLEMGGTPLGLLPSSVVKQCYLNLMASDLIRVHVVREDNQTVGALVTEIVGNSLVEQFKAIAAPIIFSPIAIWRLVMNFDQVARYFIDSLRLYREHNGCVRVRLVVILKEWQRKGFGKSLMTFAQAMARESREDLLVDTERINQQGITFYESLEFERVSETRKSLLFRGRVDVQCASLGAHFLRRTHAD